MIRFPTVLSDVLTTLLQHTKMRFRSIGHNLKKNILILWGFWGIRRSLLKDFWKYIQQLQESGKEGRQYSGKFFSKEFCLRVKSPELCLKFHLDFLWRLHSARATSRQRHKKAKLESLIIKGSIIPAPKLISFVALGNLFILSESQ